MRTKKNFKELINIVNNIYNVSLLTIKSSKWNAVGLLFINIFMGVLIPCNLIIWKQVINTVTNALKGGSINRVFFLLGLWALNICIINLIGRICNYLQNMQAKYMDKYIGKMIMEKIDRLDLSYFDVSGNYDKAAKANGQAISNAVSILNTLVQIFKSMSILITSTVILISFNYKVVVICVLSVIPVFLMDLKNYAKEYEIYVGRVSKLRHIGYLRDMILRYENIKEIKVFRANNFLKDKIINKTEEYIKEDKKIKKNMIKKVTLADGLQNLLSYLNKGYIVFLIVLKRLTIGDLVLYIDSLGNLETAVRTILNAVSSIYSDNLYIDNLFVFLNEKESKHIEEGQEFPKNFKEIRFDNVYFKYPQTDKFILEDINMTIKRDKIYAFVGENGSGKTTLIKLCMGLYKPSKGNIYIDDINIENISQKSLFEHIGVIFQDFIKYPLSAQENIGIGKIEDIQDTEKIKMVSKFSGASKFIETLPNGYKTQLQKQWDEGADLSIGQWQKVAISRALMASSDITILDEPTAALDPKAEYELFNTLKKLMIDKTCLFITHRFSNVQLADEIFVIEDGKIIEADTHEKLIKANGVYAELYNLQAEAYVS